MMNTTSQAFFELKYQQSSDPWRFATSPYELGRYATILRSLAHDRYQRCFEPGCSIGVLTEGLSSLCGQVEAIEISPAAAALARDRCAARPNVTVHCAGLVDYTAASFDLLVLSEVGYYFSAPVLQGILGRCVGNLTLHGTMLASHWLGSSSDHILGGDAVHEMIASIPGIRLEHSIHYEGFRLDRWKKIGGAHG
jgi:predicted TPR repeat methyltransferase